MNTAKIVTKDITQLKVSVDHYENRDYEWDGRFTFDVLTTPIEVKAKEAKVRRVLERLNDDITWPEAPTYEDVLEMVEFGSQCWILMYEDLACGWYWLNTEQVTKDFKSPGQKLKPHEVYLGTGTVSRKDKKVVNASQIAFRQAIELGLRYNRKEVAYLYCDNWNHWSIKLCKGSGMYEHKFIDE